MLSEKLVSYRNIAWRHNSENRDFSCSASTTVDRASVKKTACYTGSWNAGSS